ncbi:uncharacterized protein BJ212DRAFT_1379489 [Suillus subaureus]|uniref:Pentatricopeptide repeat-containing protein-mitochondrial domain-containing protein n=1 Tax=Suillus subaureus TaxID=48587 RepID=A0A9P7J993_9AGAM|nr:uncharacterized protein BJ212DRAFT_1379489 [Suillus subaureus]KAG1809337.1 hypothetical protein BJ212DRAFT_1379489 [Suillus subaureus]
MLASTSRNSLKRVSRKAALWSSQSECTGVLPVTFSRCQSTQQVAAKSATRSSSSTIRNKPWSFVPDQTFQGTARGSAIARYQFRSTGIANSKKTVDALRMCGEMKKEGVKPDIIVYNNLLACLAEDCQTLEAWAVVEDMSSMGIAPDRNTFHHLIHASRRMQSTAMWDILDKMDAENIPPNEQTFQLMIQRYTTAEKRNLEFALQCVYEMGTRGLVLELTIAQDVIRLAAELSFPRLAVDLAENFEATSVRRLSMETWMRCLASSAEILYAEGVQRCWEKVVGDLNVTPDEGLCLDVLHTAGRHGLSDLATDVIRVLRILGADWQEHHFAPLLEALCKAGKLKDAFGTLDLMRSSNIFPTAITARPIYDFLKQDIDKVDGAWELLDKLRSEGKTIDRTAINAIIRAAISLSDLQRAVGAYKAFPDYKCVPDIDTFNSLLSGCIVASHRELGDRLLLELKELGIKPDATTYERIIILCLTQATYEDAFFYLEEMKAQKFVPPRSIYDAIIRTCVAAGDSRYTLALDELKQCGYTVSNSLQEFIDSGGRESRPRS